MRPNWTTISIASFAIIGGVLLLLFGGEGAESGAAALIALAVAMAPTRPALERK